MRILIAALAEHASESSPGSKLNVSGVFDVIAAESFPTVLPAAALVLRLQFEYEDGERTHTLQIVLLTQDGEQVINIEDEIQMQAFEQLLKEAKSGVYADTKQLRKEAERRVRAQEQESTRRP